jgi:Trk K+ transport system NAD-binding subunit
MANNALWLILQKLRTPLLVIIVTYSIAIMGMVLIPGVDDKGDIYHLSFFDAFYFVSYMASTIGFGESPYDFTYAQKLWVSVCIYLTVVGWFYGIGALVSVLSDPMLKHELMRNKFRKKVREIQEQFVIVLGYSYINAEIIKKLHKANIEVVLVDINEEMINNFLLESLIRDVPVMVGDGLLTDTLVDAGILQTNCKAIISLFENEEKNLRISVLTRFLNPKVQVIAKSTHNEISTSIMDTDIAMLVNPFEIFAKRLDIALHSPHILVLENWIYGNSDLCDNALFLPNGKYVVCGYGRFGKALQKQFEKNDIAYVFIDEKRRAPKEMLENETFIRANPDDKEVLIQAGIQEAECLIVGTKNDIENISIMITAKKLNPDIYLIARENTMDEVSIFQAADIDWTFIIERIMVNKTSLALTKPLKNHFLHLLLKENEIWANSLVKLLKSKIGSNPELMYLEISMEESYAIYHDLKDGEEIKIEVLQRSLGNWKRNNNVIPLLIQRHNEDLLLPQNVKLEIGDKILLACDQESREEISLIASNIYELHYAKSGEEKQIGLLGRWFS